MPTPAHTAGLFSLAPVLPDATVKGSDKALVEMEEWDGLLKARRDPADAPVLRLPVEQSRRGQSGTFLAVDAEDRRWWVKPTNNLQSPRVPATELIIARVGGLIGAPACECLVVRIPEELVGWQFRQGARLEPGFAHGSLAIDSALELRVLVHRDKDENARRHAGVYALHDWCWGNDTQWLYAAENEYQVFSHDHGHFLPGGPNWTRGALTTHVDEPHVLSRPAPEGVNFQGIADRLREVSRDSIAQIIQSVPASWEVSNSELEALGFFLERRAPAVAERLPEVSS